MIQEISFWLGEVVGVEGADGVEQGSLVDEFQVGERFELAGSADFPFREIRGAVFFDVVQHLGLAERKNILGDFRVGKLLENQLTFNADQRFQVRQFDQFQLAGDCDIQIVIGHLLGAIGDPDRVEADHVAARCALVTGGALAGELRPSRVEAHQIELFHALQHGHHMQARMARNRAALLDDFGQGYRHFFGWRAACAAVAVLGAGHQREHVSIGKHARQEVGMRIGREQIVLALGAANDSAH
jgi:hypothetical protein